MHDGGRPAAAPPAKVTVRFNGTIIGTIDVRPGFQEYRLALPADSSGRPRARRPGAAHARVHRVGAAGFPRRHRRPSSRRHGRSRGRALTMRTPADLRASRARAGAAGGRGARAPRMGVARRGDARAEVRRVLLLRLERIGDLLMVLDAIRDARAAWPDGRDRSRGRQLERAARAADSRRSRRIDVADAPWLARGGAARCRGRR